MATPDFSQIGGPATDADDAKRSYWSKPEGIVSLLLLAAIGAVGVAYFNRIVEFLIRAVENTLYLGFLLAALALLIFLFTSKDVRTAVFFLWKSFTRGLAGTVIQLNPIAIMKIYIEDLKEKRQKMQGQIDTLAGQLVKLNKRINENNDAIKQKFAEANKANSITDRPGMKEAAHLATIEGAGLQQMNEKTTAPSAQHSDGAGFYGESEYLGRLPD